MKKGGQSVAEYIEDMRRRGFGPRRLADVAGETIKWASIETDEGEAPIVDIQFESGKALLIRLDTAPKVAVEWHHNKNGDLEPIPGKKIFE